MDIKSELGKKIRILREEKGLSRESFCDDELELTVRQLARIEAGQSLPTLPKLSYISKKLSVPIHHLINEKHIELPKRYLQLKYALYKLPVYGDESRVEKKESYFDEIYEHYYEKLPEEEQLAIDVQRATMDVHLTENADFGEEILADCFFQTQRKTEFSVNDLLLINLYFHCVCYENYDEEAFDHLLKRGIKQIYHSVDIELLLLNKVFLTAANVVLKYEQYDKLKLIIDAALQIMSSNQDFQNKPIIDMMEGKYFLLAEGDVELAREKYIEGAQFARLLGDTFLCRKIEEEWEADVKKFSIGE